MKKKIICLLITLAVAVSVCCALSLSADAASWTTSGNLKFMLNSDGNSYTVAAASTSITTADIPSTFKGKPVTGIGFGAFQYCFGLTSITIPNSVTSIGSYAFSDCEKLETIYFKGSEEQWNAIKKGICWDEDAGSETAKGTYTVIFNSDGDDNIVDSGKCGDNLTWKLTKDGTLTISGTGAMYDYSGNSGAPWFKYASRITKLNVASGVTSIGDYAMSLCPLTAVTLPASVTRIGSAAFMKCTSLISIQMPGVTVIDRYAFNSCSALSDIGFGKTLTSLGYGAFSFCSSLTSVTLPAGFDSIDPYAFAKCYALQSVTVPSGVRYICEGAFGDCKKLSVISLPGTLSSIGTAAFANDNLLDRIKFGSDKSTWENVSKEMQWDYGAGISTKRGTYIVEFADGSVEESGYSGKCGQNVFWRLDKATGELDITGSGKMYDFSFDDSKFAPWYIRSELIKTVIIGEGIIHIGEDAFNNCRNITNISIPDSIRSIGGGAFANCESLQSLYIPKGLRCSIIM